MPTFLSPISNKQAVWNIKKIEKINVIIEFSTYHYRDNMAHHAFMSCTKTGGISMDILECQTA